MTGDEKAFRSLHNFRAGIEATTSFLEWSNLYFDAGTSQRATGCHWHMPVQKLADTCEL